MNRLNEKLVDLDFVCKIIGTHKGLVKSDLMTLDLLKHTRGYRI